MIRVCFHGAESTGKSTLAAKLAAEWNCPLVPEYGRIYAETKGTDFTPDDLLAIAAEQDRLVRTASAEAPAVILIDTDPLMTAAWSQMLFGSVPQALMDYTKADLYLLFEPDVPWVWDDTRFFGLDEARVQFAEVAKDLLVEAGVQWRSIAGDWDMREAATRTAIEAALG